MTADLAYLTNYLALAWKKTIFYLEKDFLYQTEKNTFSYSFWNIFLYTQLTLVFHLL